MRRLQWIIGAGGLSAVLAACVVVGLLNGSHDTGNAATFTAVDLDWLLDKMPVTECRQWDGARVSVTGDAAGPFWGVAPYQLFYHYQGDHPWFTPRPFRVVPVPGDRTPWDRERVTVDGVLHVKWSGGSEPPQFTLTAVKAADPPGVPSPEPFHATGLLGLLPLIGFPALLFVGVRRAWRVRQLTRNPTGRCASCGYDVRASPDRCPECGRRRASSGAAVRLPSSSA